MPCEIVENQANWKQFFYCRTHKEEAKAGCCPKGEQVNQVTAAEALKRLNEHRTIVRKGFYYIPNLLRDSWDELPTAAFPLGMPFVQAPFDGYLEGVPNDQSTWRIVKK
jgi:hypothetical protein